MWLSACWVAGFYDLNNSNKVKTEDGRAHHCVFTGLGVSATLFPPRGFLCYHLSKDCCLKFPDIMSKFEQHVSWHLYLACHFVVIQTQTDDHAEVYIIVMLSGHKAGSETGRDRDWKKRTTDRCAEVCSTAQSGCGLSGGLRWRWAKNRSVFDVSSVCSWMLVLPCSSPSVNNDII